jgi:hypothetical protein
MECRPTHSPFPACSVVCRPCTETVHYDEIPMRLNTKRIQTAADTANPSERAAIDQGSAEAREICAMDTILNNQECIRRLRTDQSLGHWPEV